MSATRGGRLAAVRAGVAAALLGGACAAPPGDGVAVHVWWASAGAPPTAVEVTVAGPDLPTVTTARARGAAVIVRVPPGAGRTFTARAFDEDGTATHAGSAVLDVGPSATGPVRLELRGTGCTGGASMLVAALPSAPADTVVRR